MKAAATLVFVATVAVITAAATPAMADCVFDPTALPQLPSPIPSSYNWTPYAQAWCAQLATCGDNPPDCVNAFLADVASAPIPVYSPDPAVTVSSGSAQSDLSCTASDNYKAGQVACTQCPAPNDCGLTVFCGFDPYGNFCGGCAPGKMCVGGVCKLQSCCDERSCGPDPCNPSLSCGECSPGWDCNDGACTCTDACTEATCGQTVCGQQCPACCTKDECGVCNGPGKVCGQCNYTGPRGGCDGCGNVWYDVCGVVCGNGSSCVCNGTVNACGECDGPTGGCDGCGNVWYDACGQPCGDGSECSGGGGGGGGGEICPDYGAGMCGDTKIGETISVGRNVATSRSVATSSGLELLPEERHRRSPEERAARAADAVRVLKAWRLEATHRLKMTPAERVQLGKILERQTTALRQRGGKAGGGRRQAQLQANAEIAKLLGAQRFARYKAVRTEWMTRNQASRGSAH